MNIANRRRLAVLALLVGIIALLAFLDVHRFATLSHLHEKIGALHAYRAAHPYLAATWYFLSYVLVAALSFPGAVVLTMAGGALFGLLEGTVLVSFASTIGATIACAISRFLLRDLVLQRGGQKIRAILNGVDKDGAYYLFGLRLVPVFPFFLVNLAMGLTNLRLSTFYWVSQAGMLAATIVYVNAGTHLARISSVDQILSFPVLSAMLLLAILPMAAHQANRWTRKRRIYSGWRRPQSFDRNLVVLGGGAAGLVTAYVAAAAGARVTLIEKHRMGGDCLNTGCVPSKALIRSAQVADQIRNAGTFGLSSMIPSLRFSAVMDRVQRVIQQVAPHDSVERYTNLGVEVITGHGTLVSPWEIAIEQTDGRNHTLTTRNIVLATGANPFVPDLPGLESVAFLTTDNVWELRQLPARLVVLGGGPIGCELAQAFSHLGSQVTLVELGGQLLGREDPDVAAEVERRFRDDGIRVLLGHEAIRIEGRVDTGQPAGRLVTRHQDAESDHAFDRIILALGRSARVSGYGLEDLGVRCERTIVTDAYMRTSIPNIFAVGDVAGPYQFTHVAAHQAWYAAVNALFAPWLKLKVDYRTVPWATFVDPEVARVGLNETDARTGNIPVEVTRFELAELDRAIADSATSGFVKVLTPPGSDRILGVTIVGRNAAEMLPEFVLAMRHKLGLRAILSTIHIYPTFSEAGKYAAGAWRRKHLPVRILGWVRRLHAWRLRA